MSKPVFFLALILSTGVHFYMLGFGQAGLKPLSPADISAIKNVVSVIEMDELTPPLEPEPEPVIEETRPIVEETTVPPRPEPLPQPPPQPRAEELPMDELFEPEVVETTRNTGDFAGGSDIEPDQPLRPGLRIDWGDLDSALSIMTRSGMKLVILENTGNNAARHTPPIRRELVYRDGHWRIQPLEVSVRIRYSNRLRIVHDVPAFRAAAAMHAVKPGDRLAIMLPRNVEQILEAAQLTAAYSSGLQLADISNFAGQFQFHGRQLSFDVTQIQKKEH